MEAMPDSPESGTRYVLNEALSQAFAEEGYLKFDGIISRAKLAQLSQRLGDEFEQQRREGRLFSGGGTVSGHLNCFPGAESRFVLRAASALGHPRDCARLVDDCAARAEHRLQSQLAR